MEGLFQIQRLTRLLSFGVLCFGLLLYFPLLSCKNSRGVDSDNTMDASLIKEKIKSGAPVYVENKTITGSIDLINCYNAFLQHEGVVKSVISCPLIFKNCHFTGEIVGFTSSVSEPAKTLRFSENVCFINCIFEKTVDIRAAVFQGFFTMQGCLVNADLLLTESVFSEGGLFVNSVVTKEFAMQNCRSMGKIDASGLKCFGGFSCQGSIFLLDFLLNNTVFEKSMELSLTVFHQGLFLNYCTASTVCNMSNSDFRGRLELMSCNFNKLDLHRSSFQRSPFCESLVVATEIDLKDAFCYAGSSWPLCFRKVH